ncbi:MAG: ABC transporter ATP-binding protein [Planctomycetota bacterium]|nr:MAG: ABC transporter ATP-binding protein [Planctomycetota bacterium]
MNDASKADVPATETAVGADLFEAEVVGGAAIVARDVRFSFGRHEALAGVSFAVAQGSLHGFVGPNGAGKTTCLKLICTLLPPQDGTLQVFGLDVRKDVRRVRRRIGFMPDYFSMYRQMTVYEYLDFFGAAYGLSTKQRDRVIRELLELTDMAHRADDLVQGLSRGMQQRVGLARALINDPELLLLDEPASGLDPRARIELMEILRALRDMGKTIFISSHILSELAELCDSVTIIDRGRIRYSGRMERLLDAAHPGYRVELAEAFPELPARLRSCDGVTEVEAVSERPAGLAWVIRVDESRLTANDLLQALIAQGARIAAFQRAKRHLNEAFLALTEEGVR